MLTSLLVPYIYLTFPNWLFGILRYISNPFESVVDSCFNIFICVWISGDIGRWITLVGVILRLFFPHHFAGLFSILPNSLLHEIRFEIHFKKNKKKNCRLPIVTWFFASFGCGISKFGCWLCKRRMDWCDYLPRYWMLSSPRTHQSFWRFQECIHQIQWNFQHYWYRSLVCLPSLGFDRFNLNPPHHCCW